MPNREVIEQWVAALRSGEYKQTTGKLHRTVEGDDYDRPGETAPEGMCCLGVLCDLAHKAGIVGRVSLGPGVMAYAGEADVLPRVVKEWAGFEFDNPFVYHTTDYDGESEIAYDQLSLLNDDHRLGFDKIADAIEATYLAKSDAGQPA